MTNLPGPKVALITGAAKRIGAELARTLHKDFNILIHYGESEQAAHALQSELEALRPNSARCLSADLADQQDLELLAKNAESAWGHVDLLINNASRFYPTALQTINLEHWDDLINTNLRGPLFLCQALAETLKQRKGCILNLVDIYAEKPLRDHPIYSISKAGLAMLTKSLATELGPEVRVNGISPGAILWPENSDGANAEAQADLLDHTALKQMGNPKDICEVALFLIEKGTYITGQIIAVDGGRKLYL